LDFSELAGMSLLRGLLLSFGLWVGVLQAQPAFQGALVYKVRCEDSTEQQLRPYLPDTIVQYWHPAGVLTTYSGAQRPWARQAGMLLYLADSSASYVLDTVAKVAYKQPAVVFEVPGMAMPAKWEAPMGQEVVAGLPCTIRQANVNLQHGGGKVRYRIWTTPSIVAPQGPGWTHIWHEPELKGAIPLRKQFAYEELDLLFEIGLVAIQHGQQAAPRFWTLAGYRIQPFDPQSETLGAPSQP
jgi:hypothetical protein